MCEGNMGNEIFLFLFFFFQSSSAYLEIPTCFVVLSASAHPSIRPSIRLSIQVGSPLLTGSDLLAAWIPLHVVWKEMKELVIEICNEFSSLKPYYSLNPCGICLPRAWCTLQGLPRYLLVFLPDSSSAS